MSIVCETEKCGQVLSDAAEKCPKCRYPTPWNQERCRNCFTILAVSDHRYTAYSNYVSNGYTSSRSYVRHTPCTNCGEPEPLRRTAKENPAARRLLLCLLFPPLILLFFFAWGPQWIQRIPLWLRIFILFIIGGAVFAFYKSNENSTNNNPASLSSTHRTK